MKTPTNKGRGANSAAPSQPLSVALMSFFLALVMAFGGATVGGLMLGLAAGMRMTAPTCARRRNAGRAGKIPPRRMANNPRPAGFGKMPDAVHSPVASGRFAFTADDNLSTDESDRIRYTRKWGDVARLTVAIDSPALAKSGGLLKAAGKALDEAVHEFEDYGRRRGL